MIEAGVAARSTVRDDRILPETRIVAYLVPPFLVVAFILLYLFPGNTAELFAWKISPDMTPLLMGGGYISGSYFFVRVIMGSRWHHFAHGFPAIAAFTWFMGIATALHWDKFNHGHISFYAWLILYAVTPFIVPAVWLRNRRTDPGIPDLVDVVVPQWVRSVSLVAGAVMLLIALFMLVVPDAAIAVWPWKLTPLTARVVGGWFALPAMVGIMTSTDSRWSSWRTLIESQMIGLALILVSTARAWGDFDTGRATTWLFVLGIALLLGAALALYVAMQSRYRKAASRP